MSRKPETWPIRVDIGVCVRLLLGAVLWPVLAAPAMAADSTPAPPKAVEAPAANPKQSLTGKSAGPQSSLDELFLFQPTRYPEGNWNPQGLNFEDVHFQSDDGTKLHGWYCPHDKPRAVLLYAHGNAGNVADRAGLFRLLHNQQRVTVLGFDYRGYGRSEGVPTTQGILRDARAARTFLARRAKVAEADIVLMGRSLGGAVAVELAADGPARGLILESTFTSVADVAAVHYPPLLAALVPKDRLNAAARIADFRGPLLQSHGDSDHVVPFEIGEKLYRSANKPKQFVRLIGRDHNDPPPAEYYAILDRFLGSLPPLHAGKTGPKASGGSK